jgi:hypothetical protein
LNNGDSLLQVNLQSSRSPKGREFIMDAQVKRRPYLVAAIVIATITVTLVFAVPPLLPAAPSVSIGNGGSWLSADTNTEKHYKDNITEGGWADTGEPDLIRTNAAGQTYGPLQDNGPLQDSPAVQPDLVRVAGVNNRIGYCYYQELNVGGSVKNPDEAIAYMYEINRASARGFRDYIASTTGHEPLATVDEVADVFKLINAEVTHELAYGAYDNHLQKQLFEVAATAAGLTEEEVVAQAVTAANAANDVHLTVYLSDGKTAIDEYIIDR